MRLKILPSCENDPLARELSGILSVEVLPWKAPYPRLEADMVVLDLTGGESDMTIPDDQQIDILDLADIIKPEFQTMDNYAETLQLVVGGWWR